MIYYLGWYRNSVFSDLIGLTKLIHDFITSNCTYEVDPDDDMGNTAQKPLQHMHMFLNPLGDLTVEEAVLGSNKEIPVNMDGCLVKQSEILNPVEIRAVLEHNRESVDKLNFDNCALRHSRGRH